MLFRIHQTRYMLEIIRTKNKEVWFTVSEPVTEFSFATQTSLDVKFKLHCPSLSSGPLAYFVRRSHFTFWIRRPIIQRYFHDNRAEASNTFFVMFLLLYLWNLTNRQKTMPRGINGKIGWGNWKWQILISLIVLDQWKIFKSPLGFEFVHSRWFS